MVMDTVHRRPRHPKLLLLSGPRRAALRWELRGDQAEVSRLLTHLRQVELEPADVLDRLREELSGDVDLFLPVTHLGVDGDEALAARHPDLPLVVGGHSHSLLRRGVTRGKTLIVQAGSKASVVGRVDLWLDPESGEVLEKRASLIELYEDPALEFRSARVDEACAALGRTIYRWRPFLDLRKITSTEVMEEADGEAAEK